MSEWAMKRFWTEVTVEAAETGHRAPFQCHGAGF